jgi:hypothetical protein
LFARLRRLATDDAYQRVPRAGRMPRSLSALMIASSVVAPVLRIASMTGKRPDANWSVAPIWIQRSLAEFRALSRWFASGGSDSGPTEAPVTPAPAALPSDETRPHRTLLFRFHQHPSTLPQLQAVARIDEQRFLEGRTRHVEGMMDSQSRSQTDQLLNRVSPGRGPPDDFTGAPCFPALSHRSACRGRGRAGRRRSLRWPGLSEQFFRIDKWSVCRRRWLRG